MGCIITNVANSSINITSAGSAAGKPCNNAIEAHRAFIVKQAVDLSRLIIRMYSAKPKVNK